MRSTRNSVAWAVAAALSTTLIASVVSAQSIVPRSGIAQGVTLPANKKVYALTSDNVIYSLDVAGVQYNRMGRVETEGGNLIGFDFRSSDRQLYGLTDLGGLYVIDLNTLQARRISTVSPRFTGGFGNVMDFNPVVDAIRIMGSNDQNLAVVSTNGGTLNTTAVQTTFAYTQGDVNFGKDPEIVGGAYTNNFQGATTTIFYMIDHDKDTLVTIADKTATGSSNTGGGKLQTIGSFVDQNNQPLNMSPTTDFDIYTDNNGTNFLVGQTTRLIFSIDLSQINPNLPVGQTQKIVVKRGQPGIQLGTGQLPLSGGVFDIAIKPRG
jgi:hypothetical protein